MLSANQIAAVLHQPYLQNKVIKWLDILRVDTNSWELKVYLKHFEWAWSKMGLATLITWLQKPLFFWGRGGGWNGGLEILENYGE